VGDQTEGSWILRKKGREGGRRTKNVWTSADLGFNEWEGKERSCDRANWSLTDTWGGGTRRKLRPQNRKVAKSHERKTSKGGFGPGPIKQVDEEGWRASSELPLRI